MKHVYRALGCPLTLTLCFLIAGCSGGAQRHLRDGRALGDQSRSSAAPAGEPSRSEGSTATTWRIDNRSVTEAEFTAFRAMLECETTFVDERLPAREPSGRGGFNAIWKAKGPDGKRYVLTQTLLEGVESWRIRSIPADAR